MVTYIESHGCFPLNTSLLISIQFAALADFQIVSYIKKVAIMSTVEENKAELSVAPREVLCYFMLDNWILVCRLISTTKIKIYFWQLNLSLCQIGGKHPSHLYFQWQFFNLAERIGKIGFITKPNKRFIFCKIWRTKKLHAWYLETIREYSNIVDLI